MYRHSFISIRSLLRMKRRFSLCLSLLHRGEKRRDLRYLHEDPLIVGEEEQVPVERSSHFLLGLEEGGEYEILIYDC